VGGRACVMDVSRARQPRHAALRAATARGEQRCQQQLLGGTRSPPPRTLLSLSLR
jgi:hypothetical protein